MKKLSIVQKMVLAFLAFTFLSVMARTIISLTLELKGREKELQERINMFSANLAGNISYYLLIKDTSSGKRMVDNALTQKDIVSIEIFDKQGNLFYGNSKLHNSNVRIFKCIITTEVSKKGEEEDDLMFGGDSKSKENIGEIELAVSLEEFESKLKLSILYNVSFGIIIGLVFMLLMYYLLKGIIKTHLSGFISGIEKVSQGNFSYRIPVSTGDEMAAVSKSFNTMAENLKSSVISKEFLDSIIQNIADGVVVTDEEGKITIANRAFLALSKYSFAEIVNFRISDLLGKGDLSIFNLTSLRSMKDFEAEIVASNDEKIQISISCSTLENPDGTTGGFVFLLKDLRDFRKMQGQMMQSEKMAAVGKLASGVAHEINNPLTVILGYSQIMLKKTAEDNSYFKPLKMVEKETIRCKVLVDELLKFSRMQKATFEKVDLNKAVLEIVQIIETKSRVMDIEIVKELDEAVYPVTGNKNQLQQVITNLCNNALDALEKEGKIWIRTKHFPDYALLEVEDNGTGISADIQKQVFEPFFTTKEVGKGTGLGLSLTFEIIKKHGFEIFLESTKGKGTKFTIKMPYIANLK